MPDLDPVTDWLVLDVETASFLDIKNVTADVYAEHPSTHVYLAMMGVHRIGAGGTPEGDVDAWRPGARVPDHIRDFIERGGRVVCWNVGFERAIHRHILHPRYGWPAIEPGQWRDAQANSVAAALPAKLDHAVLAVGDQVLRKDREGTRLMKRMTLTEPLPGGGWRRPHNTPANIARLERYCAMDVITTATAYYRLPALTPTEFLVWRCDQDINDRGVYIDADRARAMSQLAAKRERQLVERVQQLTDGALGGVKGHPAFRRWLHGRGLVDEDASVNKEAVEKLEKTLEICTQFKDKYAMYKDIGEPPLAADRRPRGAAQRHPPAAKDKNCSSGQQIDDKQCRHDDRAKRHIVAALARQHPVGETGNQEHPDRAAPLPYGDGTFAAGEVRQSGEDASAAFAYLNVQSGRASGHQDTVSPSTWPVHHKKRSKSDIHRPLDPAGRVKPLLHAPDRARRSGRAYRAPSSGPAPDSPHCAIRPNRAAP